MSMPLAEPSRAGGTVDNSSAEATSLTDFIIKLLHHTVREPSRPYLESNMNEERDRNALEGAVTASMLRVFDKVQRSRRLTRDYGTGDQLTMVEAQVCQIVASMEEISPATLPTAPVSADRLSRRRSTRCECTGWSASSNYPAMPKPESYA